MRKSQSGLQRERDENFEGLECEGLTIELDTNDAEDIGELVAFLQMTQSIEFLI